MYTLSKLCQGESHKKNQAIGRGCGERVDKKRAE